MTPEQLDEIEKLAEAATPGPWKFQRRNGVWAYAREDLVFMEAMREHALPLVKALREARVERDRYKAALDAELPAAWREDIESLNSCLERIGKERDEARAECVELQAIIDHYERKDGPMFQAHLGEAKAEWALAEARAEVERLREAARQVHALAEKGRADWPRHTAWGALVDIHTITKGMVG